MKRRSSFVRLYSEQPRKDIENSMSESERLAFLETCHRVHVAASKQGIAFERNILEWIVKTAITSYRRVSLDEHERAQHLQGTGA